MKSRNYSISILIIYVIFLFITAFLSLNYGSTSIRFFNFFSEIDNSIFLLRLNSVVLSFFNGFILSISGYILQKILRNPLADPFILGISSGGILFASISIFFGLSSIYISLETYLFQYIFTFLGCLFSYFLLFLISSKIKNKRDEYDFPVIGIIINSIFSSVLILIYTFSKPEMLSEIHNSLIGSLNFIPFKIIFIIILISIIPCYFIFKNSYYLNTISFGDDFANSLGVNAKKIRSYLIFSICILISLSVSTSGVIGFIGLIVPHFISKLHRFSSFFELMLCGIAGGIVLIIADLFSRTLFSPAIIPIGVFTALIGSPVLCYLLIKLKEK